MMKTLILGLGVSGMAAARFLMKQGRHVLGVDGSFSVVDDLQAKGIQCQHDSAAIDWNEIDRVVSSPGIHPNHLLYQTALERGIEVVGEAELALPHFRKPLVAVTGTNGKTTVALLVEHILNESGLRAKALGNVGTALCDYLLDPGSEDLFVVELSSFQLETMRTPVFDAAVLLNITPDHLDRYDDMQEYAKAKCRLQTLMKKEGGFYVQSQVLSSFASLLHSADLQTFGSEQDCTLRTDRIAIVYREKIECFLPIRYRELGWHDSENALAAWALCRPFSITGEQFCKALETFRKPPHRIEFVRELDGVCFYDDSKGTNIDAVIQAVKTIQGPVILIVGGVDKGASYLPWKDPFSEKVKQIIAIGAAAKKIYQELHPYFNMKLADSLSSAVQAALCSAERGDSVLLSPGCSSYDMFRNYAHRGEEFQRQVHLLRRKS